MDYVTYDLKNRTQHKTRHCKRHSKGHLKRNYTAKDTIHKISAKYELGKVQINTDLG